MPSIADIAGMQDVFEEFEGHPTLRDDKDEDHIEG